jgi:hypothetical protein
VNRTPIFVERGAEGVRSAGERVRSGGELLPQPHTPSAREIRRDRAVPIGDQHGEHGQTRGWHEKTSAVAEASSEPTCRYNGKVSRIEPPQVQSSNDARRAARSRRE